LADFLKKNLVTLIVTSLTGEESGALFCRPPFLQYLNGALDKPDVVIEKKERAKKAKVRFYPYHDIFKSLYLLPYFCPSNDCSGNPYWRVKLSTADLLVLTSLD
jgi:hypothetical protein